MAEKTLGQVAYDVYLKLEDDPWEEIADAVVATHEARRWQVWPPCVDGALPDVVALDDPKLGRKFGFLRDRKWVDEDGVEIIEYGVPPKRWAPIPAPPQEVERGA
jgi:hypothetical protein